jgi:hypothetical protein
MKKTKLRRKMVEDMQLCGYAENTQTSYSRAVLQMENYESLLCHYLHRKLSALRFWAFAGGGGRDR